MTTGEKDSSKGFLRGIHMTVEHVLYMCDVTVLGMSHALGEYVKSDQIVSLKTM